MPATITTSSASPAVPSSSPEQWLVIDQIAVPSAGLDLLLTRIQRTFGLDPYTARQRLIGQGYALFAKGNAHQLDELQALIAAEGIPSHLITPRFPTSHPHKLQGLRRSAETVTLIADGAEFTVHAAVRVVAVFADLSGAIVEKGMKQLLVRNAYQGSGAALTLGDDATLCREILKGRPVLDLHIVDQAGEPLGSIRAFPARFDAAGLGDRATPSAGLNLLALLELSRQTAASLTLRTDFGLANLPGCRPDLPLTAANLDRNLAALTRFGSLAIALSASVTAGTIQHERPLESPDVPITATAEDESKPEASPPVSLPPPPEPSNRPFHRMAFPGIDLFGALLIPGLIAVLTAGDNLWQNSIYSGSFCAVAATFCLWRGFAALFLKRLIEHTPVSRIRSLATGMVEVSGRARRCYALVSPVTQTPCIYYRLRRYRRDQPNGKWRLSADRSSGAVPFCVVDATGEVLVDPATADLRPRTREEGHGEGMSGGIFSRGAGFGNDEKWIEETIPEGETVYVLGFADLRRTPDDSLRAATTARLRDLKGSRELHERFDRDGDGRISTDEWDEARRVVEDETAQERLAQRSNRRRQEEHLVIGAPPQRSLPFVIAQSLDEQQLSRSIQWRAVAFFLAGFVFLLWALRQGIPILTGSGH